MKNTVAIYIFKPQKKYAFLDCRYSHLEIEASGSCVCRTVLMAGCTLHPQRQPVHLCGWQYLIRGVFEYVFRFSDGCVMGMIGLLWVFPVSARNPECN